MTVGRLQGIARILPMRAATNGNRIALNAFRGSNILLANGRITVGRTLRESGEHLPEWIT